MSEQSPSSTKIPEKSQAVSNPLPPSAEGEVKLIPAQVIDGQIIVDPNTTSASLENGQILLAVNTTVQAVNYSGGFPPPEFLEFAEKHYSGATKEVFEGFRIEQQHRHSLEKRAQSADIALSYIGLVVGSILLLSLVLGSIFMFATGNIQGGTAALSLTGVIALFGYFIRLSRAKREDLDKIPEPKTRQPAQKKTKSLPKK